MKNKEEECEYCKGAGCDKCGQPNMADIHKQAEEEYEEGIIRGFKRAIKNSPQHAAKGSGKES